MEPVAPNENIKPHGARFGPEGFVANTHGLSGQQRSRAILALTALNIAFDELGYASGTLPAIVFSSDLIVNGKPRVAGIAPHYGEKDETTLFIDLSKSIANKGYSEELLQKFREQGMTCGQIAKMALVGAMFEEAKHYVDLLEGKIPEGIGPTGIHPAHKGAYYEQEHEKRALEFAETMIESHKDLYSKEDLLYD